MLQHAQEESALSAHEGDDFSAELSCVLRPRRPEAAMAAASESACCRLLSSSFFFSCSFFVCRKRAEQIRHTFSWPATLAFLRLREPS